MPQRLILHIGLHKTGTTYLQKSIWPSWDAVGYAGRPTPKGHASSEDAVFSFKDPVILMSNESSGGSLKQSYLPGRSWADLQLKKLAELKKRYAGKYDLGVLIGLRRPDAWALSIYKHYLKYGGVETLDGFLGLEAGTPATLPAEDYQFMPKIRRIEEVLGVSPFCFFLEELKLQPGALSQALATYAGVASGPRFVPGSPLNEGVNEAEAAVCLKLNRNLINRGCLGKGRIGRNKTLGFNLAKKCGAWGFLSQNRQPLAMSPQARAYIGDHTTDDLKAVLAYISAGRGAPVDDLSAKLFQGSPSGHSTIP